MMGESGIIDRIRTGMAPNETSYSGRSSALRFARFKDGIWTFDTIEFMSGDFGYDMQFGSDGIPIVVYPGQEKGELRLAVMEGSVWTRSEVPAVDRSIAMDTLKLLLDIEDRPCLYYASSGGLRFTRFDGTGWTNGTIYGPEANVSIMALDGVADGLGNHHLSSLLFDQDLNNLTLKYSTGTDGEWTTEVLDVNASAMIAVIWGVPRTSITLDATWGPHIIYDELELSMDSGLEIMLRQFSRRNGEWVRLVNSDEMEDINPLGYFAVKGKIDITVTDEQETYLGYLTASEIEDSIDILCHLKLAISGDEGWTQVLIDTFEGSFYNPPSSPELYLDDEGKLCVLLNTGYDLVFFRWSG